jgi:hypothetical protein
MKVRFRTEWAIIAGTLMMLLLLLILFGYSHPHSDDYSYNQIRQQKGFWGGSIYLFENNTGRFFSTALIFLSPLKAHSVAGYQWLTFSLFASFILSLFVLLYSLFKEFLAAFQILALSAFIVLVFCSFAPNLHEFCYWLSGAATYQVAATLWFWGIVLHTLLLQERFRNNIFINILALLNALAITGCSESGILLYALLLVAVALYRRQHPVSDNRFFYFIVTCFITLAALVCTAAGSRNRFGQTPFSGNVLLALGGGLYASCYWLAKWLLFLPAAVFLYLSVWGSQLAPWVASISSIRMFKAKYVLIAGLSFYTLSQIAAVWMSGSMPEQRFENVLFLFLLLLCLFTAQLLFYEQQALFAAWHTTVKKRIRIVAILYFAGILAGLPNQYSKAVLDVCSGTAAGFHRENQQRYITLAAKGRDIVSVVPITQQPSLLYYPALGCDSTMDRNDIPRLALANYFGKKWIYEYPCSPESRGYSLKEILKQKRRAFFPEGKK